MASSPRTKMVRREKRNKIDLPLPSQGNDSPLIPILVNLLLHLGRKTNRAHDAISQLLVQYRLVCISIILYNFIQPVNQWLLGRHVHHMAPEGKAGQLLLQCAVLDAQDRGELLDILGRGLRLPVEDGGHGDFVAAELLRDVGEGELLRGFGSEEGVGLDGETVSEAGLRLMLAIDGRLTGD